MLLKILIKIVRHRSTAKRRGRGKMQQMYSEQFPFIPPRFQRMCGRLFYIIKRGGGVRSKIFSTQPQPPRIFFLATWLTQAKVPITSTNYTACWGSAHIFSTHYLLFWISYHTYMHAFMHTRNIYSKTHTHTHRHTQKNSLIHWTFNTAPLDTWKIFNISLIPPA